jgi:hypothetical protein
MMRLAVRARSARAAVTLAACFLLAGCPGDDRWSLVLRDLPAGLVSVWGTGSRDVWAVGGDAEDGTGPWVLRFDGQGWRRLRTGTEGNLWWVHGFPAGPVFLGGAGGQVLRYDGAGFERMPTPGTSTVFGIWGSGPEDLWAVGGDGATGGFAWRYRGEQWEEVPLPDGLAASASLFKVWGRGPADVWFVGSGGTILHHDGQGFTSHPSPQARTLFTVHALGERVVAVGGFGSGLVLENTPEGFVDATPPSTRQTIGVWLSELGSYVVGANGTVLRDEAGTWTPEALELPINDDFHAVWVDPEGGVWAVGGQIASLPLTRGMLVHKGGRIPDRIAED